LPRYALLQRSLDPLPVKRLARAFAASGVRLGLDAPAVARAAFGVLVDDLTATAASRLAPALEREGIEVEVAEESDLPALPRRRMLYRVELRDDALVWSTAVGRPRATPWAAIDVAALGAVRRRPRHVVRSLIEGLDEAIETDAEPEDPLRVEDLALDLLLRGDGGPTRDPLRLRIVADEFSYECLGSRMRRRARDNFPLLAHQILERCDVVPNRGAARFHLGHPEWFSYPSWSAFDEETRWLLWKLSTRPAAPREVPPSQRSDRRQRRK
jgi:hypothetical protein